MELIEPPELAAAVAGNELPPVRERVPEAPAVADMSGAEQSIGAHGGTLNMLMGRAKDIRMMMVYGYARLVLDEAGLDKRGEDGIRLLPDGRPMQIIIQTAGESTEESDVLELVKKYWKKAGVDLFTKPSQREVFRNRVYAGAAVMSVWTGLENALVTAEMSPAELAPTMQTQLQWPMWGEHYETVQASGQAPDMAVVQELLDLNTAWRDAESSEDREAIWHEMLAIRADQVFSIGIVNGVPQPVVVTKALKNVPKKGIYNLLP
jgi:peptide/nickel transport system substrate-binding protein